MPDRILLTTAFVAMLFAGGLSLADDAKLKLRAGAAKADITPKTWPYPMVGSFSERLAEKAWDPLHARAIVLDDGTTRLAIVVVDSCYLPRALCGEAKQRAAENAGIRADRILISATHTHTAPASRDRRGVKADADYVEIVTRGITAAIQQAVKNLEPAEVGWDVVEVPEEVFNRRWFMKDGGIVPSPFGRTDDKVRMNPPRGSKLLDRPAGPIDPEVSILSLRSTDGRQIALLANYSLHYVGGIPAGGVSADYFGEFARIVEKRLGSQDEKHPPMVGIMSNGTSGDINNINFRDSSPRHKPFEKMRAVAERVANAVVQQHKSIQHRSDLTLAMAQQHLTLNKRRPTPAEVERANQTIANDDESSLPNRAKPYARWVLGLSEPPHTAELVLQAIRIGDVGITAIPCETFCEIGLELKEKSPLKPTFTIELANGHYGYLPTPRQHALGGYETWLGTCILEVEASEKIKAVLYDLLAQVKAGTDRNSSPHPAAGIMVGEVTATSCLVQVRLAKTMKLVDGDVPGAAGAVEFILREADDQADGEAFKQIAKASAERDFIARVEFDGLKPGTHYVCTSRIGTSPDTLHDGPVARIKTLPGINSAQPTRFVVVTGMNYAKFHGDDRIDRKIHLEHNNTELPAPYAGPDKQLGYPGLVSILKLRPDFFVGTGDNVYYDTPKKPRAETITEMRQKWHEQWVQPRFHDLFAAVPTYWMIDDHDFRIDDCDNSGDYDPSPELARRVMLEQLPYGPASDDDVKTYRTHRISRDLQIWLVENRIYRSPNAMKDGPEKTIWGAEQKAWLKRTLLESDATFKILISPNPMIGPDDARKTDNHTNIGGFRHERDEFFAWLKKNGLDTKGFYIICGDRHWQYHSVHPSGIEEFSCGALVDANSRLGRKPGDSSSTDPKGLIQQPYSQDPRSGGFLIVDVNRGTGDSDQPKLAFTWHDEFGKVLHRHVK